MTAARLFSVSGFVVMGGAVVLAAAMSNCGGSDGQRTGGAGSTGQGGSSGGSTGAAGSGNTGGRFACATPGATFDCTGAPLTLPTGHVTDLSMREWNVTDGKYCNEAGLRGSVFSYSGPTDADSGVSLSSNSHGVDAPAGNFRLSLTAGPAGYAGGGISFDSCVNATSFNALRFSAWVASGDITGCNFKVQLQTFEQRPTSQAPPGLCDTVAGSCYSFPASPNLALTTTPTPITVRFADFTTNTTHANAAPGQIVGLQWQLESGAAAEDGGIQPACTVEIRIDDISFVTQ